MNAKSDYVGALKAVAGCDESLGPRRAPVWRRIVTMAIDVFVAEGFQRASMEEIAVAADVSRASLYNYVPSKERLLLAAMAQETLTNLDRVAPTLDESRPAQERLFEMVKSGLMMSEFLPLTTRLLLSESEALVELFARQPVMVTLVSKFPGADKGAVAGQLLETAFPGAFREKELAEIVAMVRALGRLGATFADPSARYGQPLEALAEQIARTFIAGLERRAEKQTASS